MGPPVSTSETADVARLLAQARDGDRAALADLMPLLYNELRQAARRAMRRERSGQTLQATALVHEAWLRLAAADSLDAHDRAHFLAIAATVMRRILVERARARRAAKRGGHRDRVTLDEGLLPATERPPDLLALDAALERLAALDADQARIVELRFFGGLSIEETAGLLDLSPATVKRRWALARAFLIRELARE